LPIRSCWRDRGGGDALLVRDESESIDISLLGDLDLPSFSRRHGPLLPGRRRARAGPHRRLRRDLLRAVDRREGAGEHKEEEGPGPAGALGAGGLCRDVEGRLRLCLRLCLSSSSFFLCEPRLDSRPREPEAGHRHRRHGKSGVGGERERRGLLLLLGADRGSGGWRSSSSGGLGGEGDLRGRRRRGGGVLPNRAGRGPLQRSEPGGAVRAGRDAAGRGGRELVFLKVREEREREEGDNCKKRTES